MFDYAKDGPPDHERVSMNLTFSFYATDDVNGRAVSCRGMLSACVAAIEETSVTDEIFRSKRDQAWKTLNRNESCTP